MKTEEDFDKKYTMDESVISKEFDADSQKGMLETFGDDLVLALKIAQETPMRVWTMIDGHSGLTLIQGFHVVNRVYYMITKEEAESEDEEYLFEGLFDDHETCITCGEDFPSDKMHNVEDGEYIRKECEKCNGSKVKA